MKTNKILLLISVITFVLIFSSCSNRDNPKNLICSTDPISNGPYGALWKKSECKPPSQEIQEIVSSMHEGLEFIFFPDKKILYLKHINTGMNCKPGKISALISIDEEKKLILIRESQETAGADCECLYDLEYELRKMTLNKYHVKIIAPLTKETNEELLPFECDIDLADTENRQFLLLRTTYPWSEE